MKNKCYLSPSFNIVHFFFLSTVKYSETKRLFLFNLFFSICVHFLFIKSRSRYVTEIVGTFLFCKLSRGERRWNHLSTGVTLAGKGVWLNESAPKKRTCLHTKKKKKPFALWMKKIIEKEKKKWKEMKSIIYAMVWYF